MSSKGAFMGRAGAIHEMPPYGIINLADFIIHSDVSEGLGVLGQMGYFVAIVGTEKDSLPGQDYPMVLSTVHRMIRGITSASLDFRYCTHVPNAAACNCRMPKTGLMDWFAGEYDIDLSESIMIASHDREVMAAQQAGIPTILRLSRGRTEWGVTAGELPIYDTLLEAVEAVRELELVNV